MKTEKTLATRASRSIYIMGNLMERCVSDMKTEPLTLIQRRILGYVMECNRRQRDIYQKDLEREFQIRKSTVTGIINGMEKHGYLRRETVSHDARLRRIVPTELTVRLSGKMVEKINELEGIMRSNISDTEMETCVSVLERMISNLEERIRVEESKILPKRRGGLADA